MSRGAVAGAVEEWDVQGGDVGAGVAAVFTKAEDGVDALR
jgi:hypothetical protein